MSGSIGPLVHADEFFNHQIVETHASVLQSDLSWTEKVCGAVFARDGSLAVGFGLGKYINRNVVDAYGGVSRGAEQWTVRASRALSDAPDHVNAGPLHYEVVDPLKRVRVRLEPSVHQPIAYDLLLEGVVPCALEEREDRRSRTGHRRTADQIRYHQTGTASGWIDVAGHRTVVDPVHWVMTRDHSWGLRPGVGLSPTDVQPEPMDSAALQVLALWNPALMRQPDGSLFAFHQYHLRYAGEGWQFEKSQGGFEYADGRREAITHIEPALNLDPRNQRLLGGEVRLTMRDGRRRRLTLRVLGDTGFHLGAGLYHGLDGHHHGQWRGALHVEGEYVADCRTPQAVARLNPFRDALVEITDHDTGARGWGNCQTWVQG